MDRFSAAARDGFKGVEFLFPYSFLAGEIKARLDDSDLSQVLFNCPPGDWSAGERGIASLPGREEEFKRSLERALGYANALGCKRLHIMAGLIKPNQDRARHHAVFIRNLAYAAKQAASSGITVLIEPINTRDIPGYFLNYQDEAQCICEELAEPNLKVQMDLYHCQIMEGDLATKIRRGLHHVAHFQIAGVPHRQEPDTGEINYGYLLSLIDELGYDDWVGCEYHPHGSTSAGLGWASQWLNPIQKTKNDKHLA